MRTKPPSVGVDDYGEALRECFRIARIKELEKLGARFGLGGCQADRVAVFYLLIRKLGKLGTVALACISARCVVPGNTASMNKAMRETTL
jgi:hypothetical protein